MRVGYTAALLAALAAGAATQRVEPYACNAGFFPDNVTTFTLGQVAGPPAASRPVYGDGAGCPAGARCARRARVPGGAEVLVSKRGAAWACVWWARRPGRVVVGWMRDSDVATVMPPYVRAPLTGRWVGRDASVAFAGTGPGRLRVSGEAFWSSGVPGDVHDGSLDGPVAVSQPRLNAFRARYAERADSLACHVEFLQLGRYLAARDNRQCGGMNVTFTTVYLRAPAGAPPR